MDKGRFTVVHAERNFTDEENTERAGERVADKTNKFDQGIKIGFVATSPAKAISLEL